MNNVGSNITTFWPLLGLQMIVLLHTCVTLHDIYFHYVQWILFTWSRTYLVHSHYDFLVSYNIFLSFSDHSKYMSYFCTFYYGIHKNQYIYIIHFRTSWPTLTSHLSSTTNGDPTSVQGVRRRNPSYYKNNEIHTNHVYQDNKNMERRTVYKVLFWNFSFYSFYFVLSSRWKPSKVLVRVLSFVRSVNPKEDPGHPSLWPHTLVIPINLDRDIYCIVQCYVKKDDRTSWKLFWWLKFLLL